MIDMIKAGGPLMGVIIFLSVAGLTVILERGYYFFKNEKDNGELLITHLEKFIKNNEKDRAIKACDSFKNTSAKVMKTILIEYNGGKMNCCTYDYLEEKARECALREMPKLERHMWILALAANVTPLAGLLGTVTGMIGAFTAMSKHGAGDPTVLAFGISQALITTASGLIVAIPALIFYNFYQKKIEKAMLDMEKNVVEFINILRKM
ncbi:MAG: MotA/TolQ/ExbB proton channel family protein [Cetobacterium sp.]|uniref:MotA/TolQ/ExbB proton channel family protein n=1 Tax=unclassified Cetobacterium TaxID=2630983 RepID=UPI0006461A03|nr:MULTISPECIES: MotA/TolQ/ExbB proton channel family protein [unclassified Cetobacterium]